MDKVSNVMSVWNNGEIWPLGAPIFFEIQERGGTHAVKIQWQYQQQKMTLDFWESKYFSFNILPDQTGFVAIDGNPGKYAYILNGDASVRFILMPAFNMRQFDSERLTGIQQSDDEDAKRRYQTVIPREEQTCFHNVDTSDGKLEIFGDDGLGDCYYTYDWNTGELISARTLPRRS